MCHNQFCFNFFVNNRHKGTDYSAYFDTFAKKVMIMGSNTSNNLHSSLFVLGDLTSIKVKVADLSLVFIRNDYFCNKV